MKIQILLSTYNGEKFLDSQIESLIAQKGVEVSILVRDDGSTDTTKDILERWKEKGVLDWYEGQNLKSAKSFMDLLMNAGNADYYAFCDQDDFWLEDKLKMAITKMNMSKYKEPTLYYSNLIPVDQNLLELPREKKNQNQKKDFPNILISNQATGCTMVFNNELLLLVQHYKPNVLVMHDHWVYLVCLALQGRVIYDEDSYIKYRQHANNVVGYKKSIRKKFLLLGNQFFKKDKEKTLQIKELNKGYGKLMPRENLKLLEEVLKYEDSVKNTVKLIFNSKFRSGVLKKDLLFWVALLTRRF